MLRSMRSRHHRTLFVDEVNGGHRRSRPPAGRLALWVGASLLLVGVSAGASQPAPSVPVVVKALAPPIERKLDRAFELAIGRVRESPACGALFSELGRDGTIVLLNSRYYPAGLINEQKVCRRASAYTGVGSPAVRLCRSFGRLSVDRAAAVVIHEALHFAGLPEWPADPQAMTSAGINQLVESSCGL